MGCKSSKTFSSRREIRANTFFLIRVWRAVLFSLLVLVSASTTRACGGNGFSLGAATRSRWEGAIAVWRNESEAADILSLFCVSFFKQIQHLILHCLFLCSFILTPYPLTSTAQLCWTTWLFELGFCFFLNKLLNTD